MTAVPNTAETQTSARAEARRAQILNAARACFREHGFHGASIARICQAAGMSPGHIYHYFRNKEDIIAAIVEQDVARILDFHERMRAATDLRATVRECVREGVASALDAGEAALKLEIVAEAARNPRIAELVRLADERLRTSFVQMMHEVGLGAAPQDMQECVDTLCAMFDGLMMRGVRNPGLDAEAVIERYQRRVLELMGL